MRYQTYLQLNKIRRFGCLLTSLSFKKPSVVRPLPSENNRIAEEIMSELLKKGMESQEVANWQRFLISQGFDLEADGDFGTKTESATRQFQASQDLRGDGIVGEMTFAAAEKMKVATVGSVKRLPENKEVETDGNWIALLSVHPVVEKKANEIIELAKAEGFTLKVTQGYRSFKTQDALFAKRPKVTNARGGQSMHNYGLAVDVAFVVNGKISWDEKLYKNIGRWADAVGLEWGGNWRFVDLPHVQLKGLPSYKVLLPLYNQGGLKAVWDKYKG